MTTATPSSPPPYTTAVPATIPAVNILLLGPPSTGKSTFIASLPYIRNGKLTLPPTITSTRPLDLTRRPFPFNITLFSRPYTFNLYPSTSTLFTDVYPRNPHVLVLTYDISSRASLHLAQHYWHKQFLTHYPEHAHTVPVMLLGLKRDLRTAEKGEDGEYVCVMPQEGLNVASQIRADKYAEASVKTGELMWEVLEDLSRMAAKTTTESGGLSDGGACALM